MELVQSIKAGRTKIIVAWAVDRLMRSLVDLEELIDLVEEHSLTVITVAGDLDLNTPGGRLNARILASVARNEVEQKAARQKLANRQRAALGLPHTGGARTPGYDVGLTDVRPHEAALIQEGFSALLAGSSLRSIVRDWNAAGFKTAKGGDWTPAAVRIVIRNPRYAGLSVYQGASSKGEVMGEGQWKAIVPVDTWTAANDILKDPSRLTGGRGRARKHLLAGLAVCGKCEGTHPLMQSGAHKTGYPIYRCSAANHNQRKTAPIDAFVRAEVVARLRRGDVGAIQAGPAVDVSALRDEAATLRVRLDGLVDMRMDGTITPAQLARGTAKAEARLAEIGSALGSAAGNSRGARRISRC